jgi:hypothetical protein
MAPSPSSPPLVDNSQIKSAELLMPLSLHYHTYVWPFAIAWPVFLRFYLSEDLYEKHIGAPEWTFVWVGTIITFQSLAWLSTKWSVNLRALFTASKTKSVEEAELIKLIPIANAGAADICKIQRDTVRPRPPCLRSSSSTPTLTRHHPTSPSIVIETDSVALAAPIGRRQEQHLVPLPEAALPLRPH